MGEPRRVGFASWISSLWLYTVLRFGMFFALWGILLLAGLGGLFAALIALLLSIPLSLVLLARPRARVAAQLEARLAAQREARADLDSRLDPEHHDD